MAGAAKNRSRLEKRGGSSGPPSSTGGASQQTRTSDQTRTSQQTLNSNRSMPRSIGGKYDGPKEARQAESQLTTVAELHNFEMSFSMWDAARGVSSPSSSIVSYLPFLFTSFFHLPLHVIMSYQYPLSTCIFGDMSCYGAVSRCTLQRMSESYAIHPPSSIFSIVVLDNLALVWRIQRYQRFLHRFFVMLISFIVGASS
jgi:hypothetical protein